MRKKLVYNRCCFCHYQLTGIKVHASYCITSCLSLPVCHFLSVTFATSLWLLLIFGHYLNRDSSLSKNKFLWLDLRIQTSPLWQKHILAYSNSMWTTSAVKVFSGEKFVTRNSWIAQNTTGHRGFIWPWRWHFDSWNFQNASFWPLWFQLKGSLAFIQ